MPALEQPKRPAGGAFGIFLAEKRPEFMKACAGQKITAVTKMASVAFKELSDSDRKAFQEKYEVAKAKFDKDMAAFLAAGGVKTKGATALRSEKRKAKDDKKKKKDPNAPKRPAGGAYGCFLAEKRPEFQKACAGQPITAVSKMASEAWKKLSEAAKKPYETMYLKKSEEFKKAQAEYLKNKPAEEQDDGEEDEEEEEEEEEEEQPPAKKAKVAKKEEAPKKGAAGAKDTEIASKAKELGYARQFKALSENPKVSGIAASKILEALTSNKGAVVAARKALLGA